MLIRATMLGFLVALVASPVIAQTTISCAGSDSPTASLIVVARAEPAPRAAFRIMISELGPKGRPLNSQYKLAASGETLEFTKLCPGKYRIDIHAGDVSDCAFSAEKEVHLRRNQSRNLKVKVTRRKGVVCE
jgi:hypothetical protein